MEVDEAEEDWEDESDGMDVDGEERVSAKRAKANSGAVVTKNRQPKTNRQLAGMRDQAVSCIVWCVSLTLISAGPRLASSQGCQAAQPWPKGAELACEGGRGRSPHSYQNGESQHPTLSFQMLMKAIKPKHMFAGKRKAGKTDRR